MSENGLITIRSQSSVKATIDRLEASWGRAASASLRGSTIAQALYLQACRCG